MLGSQYILGALVLFILFKTVQSYRKRKINIRFTLLWSLLWVTALIFIVNPYISTRIAHFFGIGRGVDLALYVSIILIFYFIFRLFVKQKELEAKLTRIVRKIAQK